MCSTIVGLFSTLIPLVFDSFASLVDLLLGGPNATSISESGDDDLERL